MSPLHALRLSASADYGKRAAERAGVFSPCVSNKGEGFGEGGGGVCILGGFGKALFMIKVCKNLGKMLVFVMLGL